MIGQALGKYQIKSQLGIGGMGQVYRAYDTELGRWVAIKTMRPELVDVEGPRFESEFGNLAALNHKNVATLHDRLKVEGHSYMILEYVDGPSLDWLIQNGGPLPMEVAVPIMRQVLDGIGAAHTLKIVHRDIKPGNILINSLGSAKVTDFGIARKLGSNRLTRVGHSIGTLAYMSPEQIQGEEVDSRSDIYSLGILLYEMLGGEPPFQGTSDYHIMRAQIEQEPPPLGLAEKGDSGIEELIRQALQKQPAERFQDAAAFRAAISECLPDRILLDPPVSQFIADVRQDFEHNQAQANANSVPPTVAVDSVSVESDRKVPDRPIEGPPPTRISPSRPRQGPGILGTHATKVTIGAGIIIAVVALLLLVPRLADHRSGTSFDQAVEPELPMVSEDKADEQAQQLAPDVRAASSDQAFQRFPSAWSSGCRWMVSLARELPMASEDKADEQAQQLAPDVREGQSPVRRRVRKETLEEKRQRALEALRKRDPPPDRRP